jgi:hypothetical protein
MFVILSVCLLAQPTTCKEERIQQSIEPRPPIACLVEGQATVAAWGVAHPLWHITKWTCVSRDRLTNDL